MVLTAVNILGSLLLLLARIVLRRLLDGETSLGASGVEVAVVVHSLLEGVAFPTEDVVTMRGRATEGRSQRCVRLLTKSLYGVG